MRRGAQAALPLFPAPGGDDSPETPRGALGKLFEDGRWHTAQEVLCASGGWAAFYSSTRWGGLARPKDERLPIDVRLAAHGEPVYAAWGTLWKR